MRGLGTYLVVTSIGKLLGITGFPVRVASTPVINRANDSNGHRAEKGTSTSCTGDDEGRLSILAEREDRALRPEFVAEHHRGRTVIIQRSRKVIPTGAIGRFGLAGQNRPGRIRVHDVLEVLKNGRSGVVSEISLVKRIVTSPVVDVHASGAGQVSDPPDAIQNKPFPARVLVAEDFPLLGLKFAFGDAVRDCDGDRMGIDDVDKGGIGGGFNAVVDPNHLEPRDRVERESSQALGREIVQGGYCQGVPLN